MGYRRDPRCGNCWRRGHTKPQCPDLSDYMKERYKDIAKNRACTHCSRNAYENATGHNKRGCKLYREDREAYKNDVITFRKICLEHYERHNIGIGTVFSMKVPMWRRYGKLAGIESDILFIKAYVMPDKLSRPRFECQSTLTGNTSYVSIAAEGMSSEITFTSCLPRNRQRTIYMGDWRENREDSITILSSAIEGTRLVENLFDLENVEGIQFPDIME